MGEKLDHILKPQETKLQSVGGLNVVFGVADLLVVEGVEENDLDEVQGEVSEQCVEDQVALHLLQHHVAVLLFDEVLGGHAVAPRVAAVRGCGLGLQQAFELADEVEGEKDEGDLKGKHDYLAQALLLATADGLGDGLDHDEDDYGDDGDGGTDPEDTQHHSD
jgi:hypothetical protein